MAAKHGTRRCYSVEGCRCADCREAQAAYQAEYRSRVANGEVGASSVAQLPPAGPGAVELAVRAEIEGSAGAEARPGVAAAAAALGRLLDSPRVMSAHPPAAKALTMLLGTLGKAPARGRRGGLALVKAMTERGG